MVEVALAVLPVEMVAISPTARMFPLAAAVPGPTPERSPARTIRMRNCVVGRALIAFLVLQLRVLHPVIVTLRHYFRWGIVLFLVK